MKFDNQHFVEAIFAAIMTASLSLSPEIHPIIIALALGVASSIACFVDLKWYIKYKSEEHTQ